MNDFDIDIDLWVYKTNREIIGRFNASVLTDSTIMVIMDDIEKHLDKEKDNESKRHFKRRFKS